MSRFLIIQTAFIGDVILATGLIESISTSHPDAQIDIMVRKGNETLLAGHPKLNKVIVWDKQEHKYSNLKKCIKEIRLIEYDVLFNLQRFGSSGYTSWRANAKQKVGFKKNPFSFCYDIKVDHQIGGGKHEIERNHELLKAIGSYELKKPKLYPSEDDIEVAKALVGDEDLIVMAPSSVWFTKQMPQEKWLELIEAYNGEKNIALIGAPSDKIYLEEIKSKSTDEKVLNLAGELSLMQSAALISLSSHTHVNDSAPLHLASAMNSRVTAYFCSTIPDFGFGPLSDKHEVRETSKPLSCRPCGLHGKKACPEGHFNCGKYLDVTLS